MTAATTANLVPPTGQSSTVRPRALMLSLVHPDFLAPLYSMAQVLGDNGMRVDIFSFSSKAGGRPVLPPEIVLHDCGRHAGTLSQRVTARRSFRRAVRNAVRTDRPQLVIASCPFSLLLACEVAGATIPVLYFSFELYDADWAGLLRSPASTMRNWRALRLARRANVVCTPSPERSTWLARRAKLPVAPFTVLNAPYAGTHRARDTGADARALLPAAFRDRPLVVHTGNVTRTQCVSELIDSIDDWPADAALVVTNVGDSPYAMQLRRRVASSHRAADILLLPLLPRDHMLAVQHLGTVGACFIRPGDNLESSMPAPNKVGEYLHAGLRIVGLDTPYLRMVAEHDVAVLTPDLEPSSIGHAISNALQRAAAPDARKHIRDVAATWYSMNVQFQPVLAALRALGVPCAGEGLA